ncbi:serine/threonine-protein kinase [Dokdonella koreensis]|uniref:Serine/threonine protein kinase n=1 Tax=Dokdonella koreensis DS-123 TaxID=1300342 RepID=A0A160DXV4_9GAMM|nr:serine/threonine-protein kinase [Dokdonella koreensis]ANB19577.1 Serine/threonine protein kinase [Dokdonella koreensis DS-123]
MSAEADARYRRAQAIAHQALDLPSDAREAHLAAACGTDVDLRREVDWLIAAVEGDEPADALAGVVDLARTLLAEARVESAAPRRYRLVERLGEGGMGQVWLAERDDGGPRQRVALKRLHGVGAPGAGEAARFLAEGRILASLQHPNIAHLIDAGFDADGQPFLAMEYVDGLRMDQWCAAAPRPMRARIELFLKVCGAVEHAHAQLVIHRDLKPANILVGADGEPRLLDFGIARLLDRDAGAAPATTVLRAMTLAYASPEQVEGKALGTATDIYSLGVVLYELVAGVRPFDHLDSEHERSNAIVSGTFPPPSRPARRAPAPRRIPADIDAIVLKAMRREPAQRYASVAELADDLRRHLAARPVLARRGQWGYRAQRYLARNRWAIATAVLLLGLAGGFTWRTLLAEREARRQAAVSDRVAEFLVSVFAAADSNLNRDLRHDLTAREVLDAGAARIGTELDGQPHIRARLLEAVGNAYRHMNANPRAAALMREAADLNLDPAVDQPLAAARCLEALANIMANGEFPADEAVRAARESLTLAERLTAPGSQPVANAWMVLSLALNRAGQLAAAQAAAETTLAMNRQLPRGGDNRIGAAFHNLCMITLARGDVATARGHCEQGLAELPAGDSLSRSQRYSRHAQLLARAGDLPAAIATMEDALAMAGRIEGERGPFGALYRLRLAQILDQAGRYPAALQRLEEALADQVRLNGSDSGEAVAVMLATGEHYLLTGQYARAQASLRPALDASLARYDTDDPRVLHARTLLARVLIDSGEAGAEARSLLDAAQAGWASKDDPGATLAPYTPLAQAHWLFATGDAVQATALLDRVEAPATRADAWVLAQSRLLRAEIARHTGDAEAALRAEEAAWRALDAAFGAGHPQVARLGLRYAASLRAAGRDADAQALEAASRPVLEAAFPADSAFRRGPAAPG